MNIWLSFLKNKIFSDIDELLKLIKIDNTISGTDYDINQLINFIIANMKKSTLLTNNTHDTENFLIEENPESLIKVINDNYHKKCLVTILESNVAINSWLIKKYEEFCAENVLEKNIQFKISNHFSFLSGKIMLLGSQAFINEISETLQIPYTFYIDC